MVVQGLGDVNKGVVKCYRKIKREVGDKIWHRGVIQVQIGR